MRAKQVIGEGQRRRRRVETEQLVDAFEVSGLRRREFCLKHGVVLGTLDFWRKRRQQERGTVASNRAGTQDVDSRAKVASGDRLVVVELAGLPAGAADGGIAVKLAKQVPATPECQEEVPFSVTVSRRAS